MGRQLQFGDWTFDVDADVVRNAQSSIRLEPQVAKLLEYLLHHQDQLLSRERLLRDVWDGRVVSDDAIHRCIGMLRQTLSPHDRGAFIRTVPKKGYIAAFPPLDQGAATRADPARRSAWRKAGTPAAAALLVIAALLLAFDVGGMRGRLLAGSSSGAAPAGVPVEIKSIAVLPFADLSPEQDQGYFAEGISEEILNLLAQRTELHVIARTSSFSLKQREADIAEIARTLGVSHLLDGSVRKDGNRVRIAARLVDPESGTQLWSDSYDRELGDILNVQAEIAVAVAAALDVELGIGAAGVAADPRIDPQAFDLYLQGLQQIRSWTAHSLVHAESSFRQSVEREPRFVRAWYGLGLALLLQVIHEVEPLRDNLPGMRELVARGLELDPDNAGLTALKGQIARYDGDIAPAERYLEQALQLDPSDVWVRNLYCFFKMDRGQPQTALAAQRRTLEIDPLNPTVYVAIGFSQLDLGNPEQALAAAQRFRELNDPGNPTAAGMNAVMKIVLWGDYAGAVRDALHGMSRLPPDERTWEECFPRGADEDSMVCRFVAEFLPKGSNRVFTVRKPRFDPCPPSLDPCPA